MQMHVCDLHPAEWMLHARQILCSIFVLIFPRATDAIQQPLITAPVM